MTRLAIQLEGAIEMTVENTTPLHGKYVLRGNSAIV